MDLLDLAESDLFGADGGSCFRGELFREQPFVMGLPASQVDGSDSDETILIQGIIDAFSMRMDRLFCWITRQIMCVVHQNCREKYHAQLEYYEQALSMMTGKKVKEKADLFVYAG